MLSAPYSRRLRIAGAVTTFTLVAAYIHADSAFSDTSIDTARSYYHSVSSILTANTPAVVNNTIYSADIDRLVHPFYNSTGSCTNFPNTDNILLVMKTGATEAFDKVPTQLLTAMQCLPDFLIFSDMVGTAHD